ncbi:MAG: formylglycine-generating enzyme family protein [Planctomycetota bacterium]|nr:MAG: formylglycine-generating enzyme family protein [Planctomycetota bacterium]
MKLPLKLAILVIVIFGLLVTGMVMWRPMKVRYYAAKLHSEDIRVRQNAVIELLNIDSETVIDCYTSRYDSEDIKERMKTVSDLCVCGDKGEAILKNIFRNWHYCQQVKIPAGTLILENGNKVDIRSLYVDKYEITREKYWLFNFLVSARGPGYMLETLTKFRECEKTGDFSLLQKCNLDLPVTDVSWHDAKAYAEWLGMRLPTMYEWEYMERAGSTGKYGFGDNESLFDEYAWYKENSGGAPHPVGQKKPNKWGIYDIYGNVWELTVIVPLPDADYTLSGGSYNSAVVEIPRSCVILKDNEVGFRCVRDVK